MNFDILDLSFLNKIDPNPLVPDKGVIKYLIKPGEPLNPGQKLPQKGFKAYIKLEGRKVDGTSLDKNKNINEIRKINLFADKYIEGIHIAVASMKKNETAWFKIEPKYHFFGASTDFSLNEDSGSINKNDPLLYKIELLDYKSTTLDPMDFEGRIERFEESREKGKELFAAKNFAEAYEMYVRSIHLIRNFPNNLRESLNEEQKDKLKYYCTILFANSALCKINIKAWYDALKLCEEGLKINPIDVKLLYRKAQCHLGVCEFLKAKEGFLKVLEIDHLNLEAKKQIETCEEKEKEGKIKEKKIYADIFKKMPEEEKKEGLEKKKKEFLVENGKDNETDSPEKKPNLKGISINELEKGIIIDANDPSNIFSNEERDD